VLDLRKWRYEGFSGSQCAIKIECEGGVGSIGAWQWGGESSEKEGRSIRAFSGTGEEYKGENLDTDPDERDRGGKSLL
jgi:hypothetical protein